MKKMNYLQLYCYQLGVSSYSQQTNGFGPAEGQTIALGSEVTVDIFQSIDKAWAETGFINLLKSLP